MTRIIPLLALASLAACGRVHIDTEEREPHTYRESIDRGGAKEAKAEIHMGAGELRMSGGAGSKLVEADLRTTGERPKFRYDAGPRGRLLLEQKTSMNVGGDHQNDWDLRLSEDIPLDVEVHLGAGRARLDFGQIKLRNLIVHMGAGQLDLDLRGDYPTGVNVEVHGGVGEANIRLPKKMDIDAEVHGGLGEVTAHGLDHTDDHYVRRGNHSGPKMSLEVHGGIGHIELDAQ